MGKLFVTLLALLGIFRVSTAIAGSPRQLKATQPGGATITLQIKGDEFYNYKTDLNDYTVVQNEDGQFVYAAHDPTTDTVVPTLLVVGIDDPKDAGLPVDIQVINKTKQNVTIKYLQQNNDVKYHRRELQTRSRIRRAAPVGVVKNLVICIRWADHVNRTLPTPQQLSILMNKEGGDPKLAPTGSLRDFYLRNSYKKLNISSIVTEWITVRQTEKYIANGLSGKTDRLTSAIKDALDILKNNMGSLTRKQAKGFPDFDLNGDGRIDMIMVLHSGYGAEFGGVDAYKAVSADRIWSHLLQLSSPWEYTEKVLFRVKKRVSVQTVPIAPALWNTSGSDIGRIGVIAHMLGRFLGLPDLGDQKTGRSLDCYSVMSNFWGCDGSQRNPPLFDVWSKAQLGFAAVKDITNLAGFYTIEQATTSPTVYRINLGPSGEYLLIENRQKTSFDSFLPSGGLAIFHVDENVAPVGAIGGYPGLSSWPNAHYRIALAQADGLFNLENGSRADARDLYRGDYVSSITPVTIPSTKSYRSGVWANANNVYISNISNSSPNMTFVYTNGPPKPCDLKPCNGNGNCSSSANNSFTCNCYNGWLGKDCSQIDFCMDRSCAQFKSCLASVSACSCVAGWFGENCDTESCGQDCLIFAGILVKGNSTKFAFNSSSSATSIAALLIGPSSTEVELSLYTIRNGTQNQVLSTNGPGNALSSVYTLKPGERNFMVMVKPSQSTGQFRLQISMTPVVPCTNITCSGAGSCRIIKNATECTCNDGRIGSHCEKVYSNCSAQECSGHGECKVIDGQKTCTCNNGWTGSKCNVGVCNVVNCSGNGYCKDFKNQPICRCDKGWKGMNCEIEVCKGVNCSGHGKCWSARGQPTCYCNEGWTGSNCEVPFCSYQACIFGNCSIINNAPVCKCDTGYTGTRCEISPCFQAMENCSWTGYCDESNGQATCKCFSGWTGPNCDVPFCSNATCKNNGTCNIVNNTVVCACQTGFTGSYCEYPICGSNGCSRNGYCTAIDGQPKCYCYGAWTGANCNVPFCLNQSCVNNGTCKIVNNSAVCACQTGFTGPRCETPICGSTGCIRNAYCTAIDGQPKCVCYNGWTGSNCDVQVCKGIDCSGRGFCYDKNGQPTCYCDDGWTGSNCDVLF